MENGRQDRRKETGWWDTIITGRKDTTAIFLEKKVLTLTEESTV
jgi:hypothetical protein